MLGRVGALVVVVGVVAVAACGGGRRTVSFYETGVCECATCFTQPFCALTDGTFAPGVCAGEGSAARPISLLLQGTERSEVFYCDQLVGLDFPDAELAAKLATCGDNVTGNVDLCVDVPSCALNPGECGPGTGPGPGDPACSWPNIRDSSRFACTNATDTTETEARVRTREGLMGLCAVWGPDVPDDVPRRYCFLLCSKSFEATPYVCPYPE